MSVIVQITNKSIFSTRYSGNRTVTTYKDFSIKREVWDWARKNNIKMRKARREDIDPHYNKHTTIVKLTLPIEAVQKLLTESNVAIGALAEYSKPWWEALVFRSKEDAVFFQMVWG